MKKNKLLPIILSLCFALCFGLCACGGNNESEYKSEKLTSDNISKYLAFNITISDCIAECVDTNILNDRIYDLSCIVTISTTRATDCHFYGATAATTEAPKSPAVILYDQDALDDILGGGWLPANTLLAPRICAQLGYDGTSSTSFSVSKKTVTGISFPKTATVEGNAISVSTPINIVKFVNGTVYYND